MAQSRVIPNVFNVQNAVKQLIWTRMTRKGKIRRLNLRPRPDDPTPNCIADYIGTRYSFRERLDNGHIVWSLKKLGEGDKLRPIFRQVVNDCLANL